MGNKKKRKRAKKKQKFTLSTATSHQVFTIADSFFGGSYYCVGDQRSQGSS